jgi:hypothetical protein
VISKEFVAVAGLSFVVMSSNDFNDKPNGQVKVCALFLGKHRGGVAAHKVLPNRRIMVVVEWSADEAKGYLFWSD